MITHRLGLFFLVDTGGSLPILLRFWNRGHLVTETLVLPASILRFVLELLKQLVLITELW